jgi:hypothetical protein
MTPGFAEFVVEGAVLGWLDGLGCGILHGPDIAAGEPAAEPTAALDVGA